MGKRKAVQTISMVPIIDYAGGTCEEDALQGYYIPKIKKIIKIDNYERNLERHQVSIGDVIAHSLDHGSHNNRLHNACYNSISEYKKGWNAVIKDFKPAFKEGQEVVLVGINYERNLQRVEYFIAGPITGWQKTCLRRSKNEEVICHRTFVDVKGHYDEYSESQFMGLTDLAKWKVTHKLITKLRNQLKAEGILGVTILFRGKAYKV